MDSGSKILWDSKAYGTLICFKVINGMKINKMSKQNIHNN
jgi:hypothetical protein